MMKKSIVVASMALSSWAFAAAPQSKASGSKKACYAVKEIVCQACSNSIEAALNKIDGVDGVHTSVKDKTTSVHYNPKKTDSVAIKRAIEGLKYTAVATKCNRA